MSTTIMQSFTFITVIVSQGNRTITAYATYGQKHWSLYGLFFNLSCVFDPFSCESKPEKQPCAVLKQVIMARISVRLDTYCHTLSSTCSGLELWWQVPLLFIRISSSYAQPFFRSRKNCLARHSERGKKTRQTEEEVGRQHQGMDRPRVSQVPKGSGEQRKMEKNLLQLRYRRKWRNGGSKRTGSGTVKSPMTATWKINSTCS